MTREEVESGRLVAEASNPFSALSIPQPSTIISPLAYVQVFSSMHATILHFPGNLDETPLNIPLRNSEMEVVIGLGLKQGTQTEWDALHAGLTERFNRKVRLPKIVDGKGKKYQRHCLNKVVTVSCVEGMTIKLCSR